MSIIQTVIISVVRRMHANGFFCENFIGASMGMLTGTSFGSQVEIPQNASYYFCAVQNDQIAKKLRLLNSGEGWET